MQRLDWIMDWLSRLDPRWVARIEKLLRRIPAVDRQIQQEYDRLLDGLDGAIHPYQDDFPALTRLPVRGRPREVILDELEQLKAREEGRWSAGLVSGAVYHGDEAHIDFTNRVYALHSQSNPLHADIWPSAAKFEAEIVAMTAAMLGAKQPCRAMADPEQEICGTVTSGGTESILLAMKTYRDWAAERRGIKHPEMIVPVTAHAAFDKAAHYFRIKLVRVPVDHDYRADVAAVERAITRRTVVIVGSAPSFPHGVVDPIEELSGLAASRGIGFHTDACLGGFILPWARQLGYPVPAFDFNLPGVTSISADTHKYGYAPKGTSVILYRGADLRRFQYYAAADWPGGLYYSPTFAGSRPGALSAACWAALVSMGEEGYREAARCILETAGAIKDGLRSIPELRILGDPLWVIAFTSDAVDIYQVLDAMSRRGWSLNGLHHPPAVHIALTLRHTQPGVAGRFIADLRASVEEVKAQPQKQDGMAPIYGMAASMPLKGVVTDLLRRYVDLLYRSGE